MADPTTIDCSTACTVTVVHQISIPPFDLDLAAAGQISSAVLLVWATGYAFRVLLRVLRDTDGDQPSTKESE